ncbi:hypothetical protein HDU88_001690 [Geranomyces variabilis]|nr:hypothetical protein HDU88_001690 [Geranomyces variabilis]
MFNRLDYLPREVEEADALHVNSLIANGKTYQEFVDALVAYAQQLDALDAMKHDFTDNQRELLEQRKRGFQTALAIGVQNYEEKAKKARQAQVNKGAFSFTTLYKRRTRVSQQVVRGTDNTTSATASVASDAFECTVSTAASIACDAFATLSTATNAFASVDGNASHDFEVAMASQQQVTVEDVDANDEDYTSDVDDSLPECREILEYRAKLADMAKSPCAVVQQTARHSELLRKRWNVYNAAILGLPKSKSLEMPATVVISRDTDACLAKMPGLQASRTALHELRENGEVETSRSWYDWPPFRTSAAAVTPEMVVMLMGALAVDATTSALSRVEATAKLLVSGVITTVVAMMAPSLQVHHEFVHEFGGTASDGSGRSDVSITGPSRREARLTSLPAKFSAKISETGTYDNTKAIIVARNPADAQSNFSILDGAHRVEAVTRFNAAQTEDANKITVLPAIVLRANMPEMERAMLAVSLNSVTQTVTADRFTNQLSAIHTLKTLYAREHDHVPGTADGRNPQCGNQRCFGGRRGC